MTRRFRLSALLFPFLLILAVLLPANSPAQSYSRVEIGAQGTSLLLSDPVSGKDERGGFGTRITYNFSPILSLDAEGDFLPSKSPTEPQRGGRAFAVLAGPKAGWRFKKVGLFVEARPGIINFSSAQSITTGIAPNGIPFITIYPGAHRTDLALDLGAVFEVNPSRRTTFRLDFGEMLVRYKEHFYPVPTTPSTIDVSGVVGESLMVSAGISYRLGELTESRPSFSGVRRWEAGGQFGLLSMGRADIVGLPYFDPFSLGDDPSFGGRLTYNFNPWLAVDTAVNYYYHNPHFGDAQRGGKILQGAFGPKAGLRTQHAGFFVKARPGFLSYGGVHDNWFPPYPTTRLTHFAVDVGGVLEFYPSRQVVLRLDLGHTLGFYGPRTVITPITPITPNGVLRSGGFRDNGMQFMTGFGWRF